MGKTFSWFGSFFTLLNQTDLNIPQVAWSIIRKYDVLTFEGFLASLLINVHSRNQFKTVTKEGYLTLQRNGFQYTESVHILVTYWSLSLQMGLLYSFTTLPSVSCGSNQLTCHPYETKRLSAQQHETEIGLQLLADLSSSIILLSEPQFVKAVPRTTAVYSMFILGLK